MNCIIIIVVCSIVVIKVIIRIVVIMILIVFMLLLLLLVFLQVDVELRMDSGPARLARELLVRSAIADARDDDG